MKPEFAFIMIQPKNLISSVTVSRIEFISHFRNNYQAFTSRERRLLVDLKKDPSSCASDFLYETTIADPKAIDFIKEISLMMIYMIPAVILVAIGLTIVLSWISK
jgi:hypothetical protein